MEKFSDYLAETLEDKLQASACVNAALEQLFIDHNKELFLVALRKVVEANGGISAIAKRTNINRQHLYRMLSAKGNPSLDNISSLLSVVGLKLTVAVGAVA